jgi:hypothetical protein
MFKNVRQEVNAMKLVLIPSVLSFLFLAIRCQESSVTEPTTVVSTLSSTLIRDLAADTGSVGKYTYFSLGDSSIVANADSTTTNWDLAFAATTIRTNSGTSGPGQGGALVLSDIDFDTLSHAPTSGYSYDTSATQVAIRTGSDRGWYHYDFATNTVTPVAGRVLVIRTTDARYAKLQILSYYKGAPTTPTQSDKPRFYTFKYVYQPDGSRILK